MADLIFDIVYACSDLISYIYTVMITPVDTIFDVLFNGVSLPVNNVFFSTILGNFSVPEIPILSDASSGVLALFFAGLNWSQPFIVCFILATCRFWFIILITKGVIDVLKTIF